MSNYKETEQERRIRIAKADLIVDERAHEDAKFATKVMRDSIADLTAGIKKADNADVMAYLVRTRSIYRKAFDEACGTESAASEDVRNGKAIVHSLCNDYAWYTGKE